ncbi:Hypothetical predicted protein [Pelobates cultripes]|uniref:Uncharacterized protein n=1 Tax=Pelobates cultripes TaxID=61616 RepID=A0AAD1VM94_PELCU|nr:Hypothetical predicted protein [Pelobates cultripes]
MADATVQTAQDEQQLTRVGMDTHVKDSIELIFDHFWAKLQVHLQPAGPYRMKPAKNAAQAEGRPGIKPIAPSRQR